jgi:hypothetical protein
VAVALVGLVIALTGARSFARADGPDIVQVVIAARQGGQATALRDNLFELFGRIDAIAWYRDARTIEPEQLMKPLSNIPPALAYVWIDLAVAKPDRVLVYLSGADRGRVLQRTVMLPNGLDEVAREEVSQIVASSVDTLRAGGPLNAGHAGDVLISSGPEKPRRGALLTLGATGAAERWSEDQSAVPAFGLSTLLGRATSGQRFEPALWMTLGYHGATTSGQAVALQLRGGSLALVASPGWRLGRRMTVRAGAGPGLDLLSVKPMLGEGQVIVRLDPPHWIAAPFVRAALRLDLDLTRTLVAFAAATGDLNLEKTQYYVEHDGTTDAVYEPSRFRPSVLVGIEGRIMGSELLP